jgi:hypothetical protein
VNRAEYSIRGLGFVRSVSDLEDSVIKVSDSVRCISKYATVSSV